MPTNAQKRRKTMQRQMPTNALVMQDPVKYTSPVVVFSQCFIPTYQRKMVEDGS